MSSIIVAGTLILNAGAVLNFKLNTNTDESFGDEVSLIQIYCLNLLMIIMIAQELAFS